MLVIARLALLEAVRRRLVVAAVLLTLAVIALSAWGFARIPELGGARPLSAYQVQLVAAELTILVAFMFSFVLALAGVFVAAPAISGEVETGIALAVLARPLSRAAYVVGKWLGLAALLLVYAGGAVALELAAIRATTGHLPPRPLEAFAYLYAEGLVLLTLALALSTRLGGMVGGVIALVLFGVAWLGGIVGGVGLAFDNDALARAGTATKLLVPTDGLWRGAVYALEPAAVVALPGGPMLAANPFYAAAPQPPTFVAWALLWIAAVLMAAVWSFRRREI